MNNIINIKGTFIMICHDYYYTYLEEYIQIYNVIYATLSKKLYLLKI